MASDQWNTESYFIGVDVGTASIRAGIFRGSNGDLLSSASHPITVFHHDESNTRYYEQSSSEIWDGCCTCVQHIITESRVDPSQVKGIAFDATCSLVAIGPEGKPVSLCPAKDDNRNIILWMDHRAIQEAEAINKQSKELAAVLQYVGNKVSPEMQIPKLMWIKKNLPESWKRTEHFFDLSDFMAYKATGKDYSCLEDKPGWNDQYFVAVGLEDLTQSDYQKIGGKEVGIRQIGTPIEGGLSEKAAKELGLLPGTCVGVGVIDAHAGGIGVLGTSLSKNQEPVLEKHLPERIALIAGTSNCHMYAQKQLTFVEGVWGPYYSAMIPGCWLLEAGQNAAGSVIDHVIKSHSAYETLVKLASSKNSSGMFLDEFELTQTVYEVLNEQVSMISRESFAAKITANVHVLADFHGNRSPLADPLIQGAIIGLTLDDSIDNLAILYLATIQSLAYGTRRILEKIKENSHSNIDTIFLTGGLAKNSLFVDQHAQITNCKIVLPKTDAVLLGSAIIAAAASGFYHDLLEAMAHMSSNSSVIEPPQDLSIQRYHEKKYKVFLHLYEHQLLYRTWMKEE